MFIFLNIFSFFSFFYFFQQKPFFYLPTGCFVVPHAFLISHDGGDSTWNGKCTYFVFLMYIFFVKPQRRKTHLKSYLYHLYFPLNCQVLQTACHLSPQETQTHFIVLSLTFKLFLIIILGFYSIITYF